MVGETLCRLSCIVTTMHDACLYYTHIHTKNRIVTRVCTDEAPRRLTEIEDLGGGVRGA